MADSGEIPNPLQRLSTRKVYDVPRADVSPATLNRIPVSWKQIALNGAAAAPLAARSRPAGLTLGW